MNAQTARQIAESEGIGRQYDFAAQRAAVRQSQGNAAPQHWGEADARRLPADPEHLLAEARRVAAGRETPEAKARAAMHAAERALTEANAAHFAAMDAMSRDPRKAAKYVLEARVRADKLAAAYVEAFSLVGEID